jgi:hypothetical protein
MYRHIPSSSERYPLSQSFAHITASTVSELRELGYLLITMPGVLYVHSEATVDNGMAKKLRAIFASIGFLFYHLSASNSSLSLKETNESSR